MQLAKAVIGAACVLAPVCGAQAAITFSFGGFVRSETAYKTVDTENWTNQLGNPYNGVAVERQAYVPPSLPVIAGLPVLGDLVGSVVQWGAVPLPPLGVALSDASEPGERPFRYADNDFNLTLFRAEGEMTIRFSRDLKLVARLRAVFDPADYDDFNAADTEAFGDGRGIAGGLRSLYGGKPNYFEYQVEGDSRPNPLEWAGENYQIYLPALVLEYNVGPLTLRLGNQQIAWGQALFFRVFDVVDGLDLRRHSVLDYAQEEFADERVPSLGLRAGFQLTDTILMDGYVQKFQPSVYGNPNTQYNVIPSQFTVQDRYAEFDYDSELSYGVRFKAEYGNWGWQAMYVDRMNPDGVFRWTESGVNRPLQGGDTTCNTVGCFVNLAYSLDPTRDYDETGEALSHTPFEAGEGGVYSAEEWFTYASAVRLDGITGLNASIEDFPGSQDVYASPVNLGDPESEFEQATAELNTFFIAGNDSLRGHIERVYAREQVYGLGGTYVFEGEPGGLLDQLIVNMEVSYTPDRTFTPINLGQNLTQKDAWVGALVAEKYYRFSYSFPATYFVLQYMYRNVDDLFGRLLDGYGGSVTNRPTGKDDAHYVAFAFQQPFPQDIYRIGFALLYDTEGSVLVQPGLKWKPSGPITVEGFYSYIDGCTLGCKNPNNTLLSTVEDFANEFTLRLSYQF